MEFYTHQQHQQEQQEQKQAQQEIITEQERQQHQYQHQLQLQQKQQLQQQHLIVVDSMATGGGPVSTNSTSTTFNSSTSSNNNNSNHNGNIISTTSNSNNNINNLNSNNNNLPTSSSSSSNNNNNNNSSGSISTADAATVAIAKDMLQLHHGGGAMNHNNKSNNSASNANGGSGVTTAAGSNGASNASSTTAGGMEHVSASSTQQNIPPAHANSSASSSSTSSASSGATSNSNSSNANTSPPDNALGYLKYDQDLLYITEACTIIGRNSSTSHVHFHVAENNLVSRKHFQVLYKPDTRDFYVQCLSKNGIFVDDFLQRRNADPLKLPASCFFRFPSTEIRIQFESFVQPLNSGDGGGHNLTGSGLLTSSSTSGIHNNNHHHHQQHHALSAGNAVGNAHVIISPAPPEELPTQNAHHHLHQQQQQQHHHHQQHASAGGSAAHLLSMDNSQVIYSPLKISIPKKEEKSPYLSPTGTISAANSCPASPRQGFHQNQANYNNYGNNNLQNKQDLFQTPSTSSYNNNEKPPYSYAQLIVQAISAAPDKQLTLSGIYSFIVKHYPYYRKETNKGWQNSIRHNLSLNRYFIKVARSQDEPGKGSFWRIDPDSGAKLIDHSYKKRRQRSSQSFRPSYGMPRSAPVSPSHMDNSRESSPLHDIVLQSAPGSPGMSMENRANDADLVYSAQHQNSSANNSHNQYNSGSPYYVTNQSAQQQQQHESNSSSGNGVGALIAVKRNHILAAGVGLQAQQQQQQSLHPDIIYEEVPADYSGNVDSGDECDSTAATTAASKRAKYLSEVL